MPRVFFLSYEREPTSPLSFTEDTVLVGNKLKSKGECSDYNHQPVVKSHGDTISNSNKRFFRRGPCYGSCWSSIVFLLIRRDFKDTRRLPCIRTTPTIFHYEHPTFLIHCSLTRYTLRYRKDSILGALWVNSCLLLAVQDYISPNSPCVLKIPTSRRCRTGRIRESRRPTENHKRPPFRLSHLGRLPRGACVSGAVAALRREITRATIIRANRRVCFSIQTFYRQTCLARVLLFVLFDCISLIADGPQRPRLLILPAATLPSCL